MLSILRLIRILTVASSLNSQDWRNVGYNRANFKPSVSRFEQLLGVLEVLTHRIDLLDLEGFVKRARFPVPIDTRSEPFLF